MPSVPRFVRLALLLAVLTFSCAQAVDGPPPGQPPISGGVSATPEIAAVHQARCGACHVRVEPGTRPRPALTVALARHRNRIHLQETQWVALLDYLAPGP